MHTYLDGMLGDDELSDDPVSGRNLEKIRKQIRLGPISEDADAAEYEVRLGSHYLAAFTLIQFFT